MSVFRPAGPYWPVTSRVGPADGTRNNYAAAKLQGLEEDLNMTDQEYQIGLSTLFVGYVLMQVPSNAMLNYAGRPSWYIGFFVRTKPSSFLDRALLHSPRALESANLGVFARSSSGAWCRS